MSKVMLMTSFILSNIDVLDYREINGRHHKLRTYRL
jgi:hypothetical protein